jgi:uncharacterized protein (DUF1786 family)
MRMVFTLDVGSGTQDFLLLSDKNIKNCPKMILPSPSRILGSRIRESERNVYLQGYTMGGGAITYAVKQHIQKYRVYADERAALTFADNLEKVREMGIVVGEPDEPEETLLRIKTTDVDMDFYSKILYWINYQLPEIYAIAVQDHGYSPHESNRIFRFKMFRRLIEKDSSLENFLFTIKNIPAEFNRMRDAGQSIMDFFEQRKNITPEIYVTDTVFAAIAGCAIHASSFPALLINFGNSHLTAAVLDNDWQILSIFEHHTGILKQKGKEGIKKTIENFIQGKITNEEVIDDGGHGCYVREAVDMKEIGDVVCTGPRSDLSSWKEVGGDPMITGNLGLIAMLIKKDVVGEVKEVSEIL